MRETRKGSVQTMKNPKFTLLLGILMGATIALAVTAVVLYMMSKTNSENDNSQLQEDNDWNHDLEGLRPFTDAPSLNFVPSSTTFMPSLRSSTLSPSKQPSLAPSVAPSLAPTSEKPSLRPSNYPTRIPFPEETNFTLKLYWELGYNWQEEVMERPWCIECMKCTNFTNNDSLELCSDDDVIDPTCQLHSQLWVQPCDYVDGQPGNAIFQVVVTSHGDLIRSSGTDLCLTRLPPPFVVLDFCDVGSDNQLWAPLSLSSRFPLMPASIKPDDENLLLNHEMEEPKCLTQQHHPREGEILKMEPCSIAHKWNTGYWVALPLE